MTETIDSREKLAELKRRLVEQQQAQEEALKAEQQLDNSLRFLLEPPAKQRLGNVRIANKTLYLKAAQSILMMYKAGQIRGKMSDEQLKKTLIRLSEKRSPTIKRK